MSYKALQNLQPSPNEPISLELGLPCNYELSKRTS